MQNDFNEKEINKLIELVKLQYRNGKIEVALESCFDLLHLTSNDKQSFTLLDNAFKELDAYNLAELFYLKIIDSDIDNISAYLNVGYLNINLLNNYKKGIFYLNKYMQITKKSSDLYFDIAKAYIDNGKFKNLKKQIRYLNKAIKIAPNNYHAIKKLAHAYIRAQMFQKAAETFEELFKFRFSIDDIYNYSMTKLQLREFKIGFEKYESRFNANCGSKFYPQMGKPKWEGQKIRDKTLLIQQEQGFGDTFMFMRYLKVIKPLVGKIKFRGRAEIAKLIQICLPDIDVIIQSVDIQDLSFLEEVDFDYHISILSLPYALKSSASNIPFAKGYIKTDQEKVEYYKNKYFKNDNFKIGISWGGSERGELNRNIPLKAFSDLTKINNVKVYSFQKGEAQAQLKKVPKSIEIVDLGSTFNDFSDTAAAIENVDLMICGDNAVLNLAGAMGKKAILILPQRSDWRWFSDTKTTPWYNSVKIYKKEKENQSWQSLIKKALENENLL